MQQHSPIYHFFLQILTSNMNSILLAVLIAVLSRTSLAKPKPPTFDLVLTYITDSPVIVQQDKDTFLSWSATAGLTEQQLITHGHEATAFFNERFGLDFTDIGDEFYTSGTVTRYGGSVTFQSFILQGPENDPYRPVSAVDHKDSAIFTNAPILEVGWMVIFHEDFISTGTSDLTIPAGSTAVFGDYLIQINMDKREQKDPFFPQQALDNGVLRITYQCGETLLPPATQPVGRVPLAIINCEVGNKYYGEGKALGVIDMGSGGVRNVLTFPA